MLHPASSALSGLHERYSMMENLTTVGASALHSVAHATAQGYETQTIKKQNVAKAKATSQSLFYQVALTTYSSSNNTPNPAKPRVEPQMIASPASTPLLPIRKPSRRTPPPSTQISFLHHTAPPKASPSQLKIRTPCKSNLTPTQHFLASCHPKPSHHPHHQISLTLAPQLTLQAASHTRPTTRQIINSREKVTQNS